MEEWLDNVVEAMKNCKLEDPVHNSWDPDSNPELRVVDPKDRLEDEWYNITWQRNVRRRDRLLHRGRKGPGSDRYA
jgi:hypothetical protein